MVAAILIAGIWGIWKALVQRRYTETAGALGVSVLFVLIALFFVYQPERTVGQASKWTNTLSLAFLVGRQPRLARRPRSRPSARSPTTCSRRSSCSRGWCCSSAGSRTASTPTGSTTTASRARSARTTRRATSAATTSSRAATGTAATRRATCARRPGSEERKAEYDALREGEAPDRPRSSRGYDVDKADAPAVDAQQAGGAYQRLTFAVDRAARRARRGRAARLPLAGGDPRPGRRARAARLRAGRADHRDLPRRRPRLLPRLADQARHRDLHQGALLARDRDRRRRLRRADRRAPARSASCSPSGCRRSSSGRSSSTASRSPTGSSPRPPAAPDDARMPRMTVVQKGAHAATPPVHRARRRRAAAARGSQESALAGDGSASARLGRIDEPSSNGHSSREPAAVPTRRSRRPRTAAAASRA